MISGERRNTNKTRCHAIATTAIFILGILNVSEASGGNFRRKMQQQQQGCQCTGDFIGQVQWDAGCGQWTDAQSSIVRGKYGRDLQFNIVGTEEQHLLSGTNMVYDSQCGFDLYTISGLENGVKSSYTLFCKETVPYCPSYRGVPVCVANDVEDKKPVEPVSTIRGGGGGGVTTVDTGGKEADGPVTTPQAAYTSDFPSGPQSTTFGTAPAGGGGGGFQGTRSCKGGGGALQPGVCSSKPLTLLSNEELREVCSNIGCSYPGEGICPPGFDPSSCCEFGMLCYDREKY